MSESKFLAFDFGAESGRAIVGILSDKKIELHEVHRFPNIIENISGNLNWNIHYLFDELKTGILKAIQKGHTDIESLAVDTWGVDFGLVSEDNKLLGSPFAYRDSRTNGMLEKAFNLMPKTELYNYTGIQFMQINSAFQLLSMVESGNTLLRSADKLLFMPDLLNFLLTGKKKSEYTIASTSQLLNAKEKKWERKIFSSLNLPYNLMADIIMPGTKIGNLHSSICDDIGLKNIDVIAVGSHDTASAVAAVPNLESNWAFISSGTWSLIGVETDNPIINEKSYEYNFTNEGGVGGKIRFLRNVMGMWIIQQLKKEWESQGEVYSYSELNELAVEAILFGCNIDTDDPAFLNPKSMVDAINKFCNKTSQKQPKSKGEYIRSVLESLAFKYRLVIDKINLFRDEKIETINIVGGGSQNELLNQFTADATGLQVIAGPVESTALGNIIVQAIATGKIKDINEGRRIIANSVKLKVYNPKKNDLWNKELQRIRKIIK
ncbi:MAG: rhamnulokinase family protein [Bacteroidota bacterium]